ncbi:hypothetical protein ONE63_000283 [Megalurothrips usitatus]|uniref:EGF-like domain-containing protein n=1 Tax=Megalurothrips usitatus TaxID=439358 RepID=A0AAV7XXZ1_9NEOP|nr:hypothetical protein ONE63_000283 [Megalurothrips usitatus]
MSVEQLLPTEAKARDGHSGWQPEVRCLCRPGFTGTHCQTRLQATNADCPESGACTDCRGSGGTAAEQRARFTITVRLAGNSSAGSPGSPGLTRHQLERQVSASV